MTGNGTAFGNANQTMTAPAMIQTRSAPQPSVKELKVNVPRAFHIRLHALRIVTGQRLSDIVTEALTQYFASAQSGLSAENAALLLQGVTGEKHATTDPPASAPPERTE